MTINYLAMSESVPRVPKYKYLFAGPSGTGIVMVSHRRDKSPVG